MWCGAASAIASSWRTCSAVPGLNAFTRMPSAASRSSSAIASSTSGMPADTVSPANGAPAAPRAEQQRVARDVQLPQVPVEQQRVEDDLAAGLEQLRRAPRRAARTCAGPAARRRRARSCSPRSRRRRRSARRPSSASSRRGSPAGARWRGCSGCRGGTRPPGSETARGASDAYVTSRSAGAAPGEVSTRRPSGEASASVRMPLPRRFSAVMRETAVPGPRSSTQSGSSSVIEAATASQRTGSTNCERTGSPTTPRTGAHERAGTSPTQALKRSSGAASAGEWNGTSTPSGDHVKRSGAPPRCPSRRSASSRAATSERRAWRRSSAEGAPATTSRVGVLTSAIVRSGGREQRLQTRERDALDRGHRGAAGRGRGHVQALDRGALQVALQHRVRDGRVLGHQQRGQQALRMPGQPEDRARRRPRRTARPPTASATAAPGRAARAGRRPRRRAGRRPRARRRGP